MRMHQLFTPVLFATSVVAAPAFADDSAAWFENRNVLTQETGEGIYNAVCAGCHMPDGQGATGAASYPALADNPTLEYPEYAVMLTLHGQAAMPPLRGVLNDEQVAAVVNYIRTSFGNNYPDDPATAEMVAQTR
ncbi:c-type cytochrome [Roseinatronobacter alkalisoli]|uniref:Cytochrome c n=1 Tax=Roseinatronobacter alkalisoli TaxID=3028235 RepID=A0ABT5TF01_9RHOB|nr:cytochrome c [Roseinatronobacter sp. HJB301]MDD7973581.1 cytochrome c [Roseinatronobacter sp. HJB301]